MSIHESFVRQNSRRKLRGQPIERSGVSAVVDRKESMMDMACLRSESLNNKLMERICSRENMNKAYKRVVSNGGAPGIDGMSVEELKGWLKENGKNLLVSLQEGSYRPQAVRNVAIPKLGGGTRWLGIPTVVDRLVQQAMLQVMNNLIDGSFDQRSYGYRPGKSAHQALKQAQEYIKAGNGYVVDIDIEKYFDTVNHDMVMSRVAKHVEDKRVLKLTRRYLQAGMWRYGAYEQRSKGTPQGGPLSPLLANLLLDDLDKELRRRGHKFCRYADDSVPRIQRRFI